MLFSLCPHPFKNKATCSSWVASWIWPELWLLPRPCPRGPRVHRNLKFLLFILTYKITLCVCRGVCQMQVSQCTCLEGLRTAGRSHFSPTTGGLRIELRLLGNKHPYPLRHLSNPLLKMCSVFACASAHACTPVEHRRPPLVSSSGIPTTSYKTGSLIGPDQPSRLDWPARERRGAPARHTWQFRMGLQWGKCIANNFHFEVSCPV